MTATKKIGIKIESPLTRARGNEYPEYASTQARGRQKTIRMKYIRFYSLTAIEAGYGLYRRRVYTMKKIGMKVYSDVGNLDFEAHGMANHMGKKKEIRMTRIRFYSVTARHITFFAGTI